MKKGIIADVILLLVAFIWGTTFVLVQNAIAFLPPHSFNGIRFTMASLLLLIIIIFVDRKSLAQLGKKGWIAGLILGVFLFAGYAFQTIGLLYTTASRAGFITGLSVILVPIFSAFFLKMIPNWFTTIGVGFAAVGLYLMTMIQTTSQFQFGDFLVFFCAIAFALQIVFTGKFAPRYSVLPLTWIQISVVGILSFIFAFFFEDPSIISFDLFQNPEVITALIITSVFATVFAFVAQTMLQRYTTATRVAIIFSMEPVFAALTAFIILHEVMTNWSIIGSLFIFLGMIIVELPLDFATILKTKLFSKRAN